MLPSVGGSDTIFDSCRSWATLFLGSGRSSEVALLTVMRSRSFFEMRGFIRRSGHIAAQTYMLAQMQHSENNVNQMLAINVRTIFHISGHSNHEGMTTATQKINMRNDCVTYINWKAGTSHAKAIGDREYVHKSLQIRRILSKEIVTRKVRCRGSPTLTPTIAEVR
jgi:hypothetical protein